MLPAPVPDGPERFGPRRPAALAWLAVLAVAAPAALGWWMLGRIESVAAVRLGESRLAFARSVQAGVQADLEAARRTIEAASRRPGLQGWVAAGDAGRATVVLANILDGPVPLAATFIVGRDGTVLTRFPSDAAAPEAASMTTLVATGTAIESERALLAASPLRDGLGREFAVLVGRLPLATTLGSSASLRFGATGAVSLLSRSGEVVATSDPRRTGRRVRAEPVRAALLEGAPAVLEYFAPSFARQEFSALVPVPGHPLAVMVSQSQAEAFLPSTRLQAALAILGAVQFAILLAFAWVGVRLLLAYERALHEHGAALAAANGELEAFSYTVAHDLRSPLRAVNGFAQMLGEDHGPGLDDEGRRYIEVIRDNATRMGQLIDDLLELSRCGRQPLQVATVDSASLVRELIATLRVSSPAAARCRFEVGELPPVAADRQLIVQVWTNLLDNAVKYSAKTATPEVRVFGEAAAGLVTFSIEDDGVGFDMSHAGKLFGVFQRLHHTEDFAGTGVGLAIVARIVGRHGGRVWAESEPGAGARFHFTLPQAEHGR